MGDLMSIDIEQRISALEERVSVLKAENLALRSKVTELETHGFRKRVPAPPLEPAVKVSNPVTPIVVDLPSDAELIALRDICRREYPSWCASDGYVFGRVGSVTKEQNDAAWLVQFAAAIRAISNMRVTDRPDKKHYVSSEARFFRVAFTPWRSGFPSALGK